MTIDARGNFYKPSPPPQSGGEKELRQWCLREYERISDAIRSGRSWFLSLDVMRKAPEKPFAGMVCYFQAAVVGASEGCYEYRSDSQWHKL